MLTETEIKAARPHTKPYKLFDGGGMYLLITPDGGRWWRLKYRINGKERGLSLGVYPAIGLKRARGKREEATGRASRCKQQCSSRPAVRRPPCRNRFCPQCWDAAGRADRSPADGRVRRCSRSGCRHQSPDSQREEG